MNLNKKQIIISALVIMLSAVIGFYGGRYYEQRIIRKRFTNRMQFSGNMGGGTVGQGNFGGGKMDGSGPNFHMEFRDK